MYVLLCGGPFGTEPSVRTAGPSLAILVLSVMALLWAVPYALIVGELVAKLPLQGGLYQWFRAGLGPFWSFQFTYLDWSTWVLDAALYPPMVAAYMVTLLPCDPGPWARWGIALVVIWSCTWMNIRGVREVGRMSVVMTILQVAPVLLLIVLGARHFSFDSLRPLIPEGQSFVTSLNYALVWSLWSYSGYGALAAASEEIVDPQRNYPRVLAIFLPLSVLVYVVPLVVGLAVTPDWRSWEVGQLNLTALALGGTGLMVAMLVAAQLANVGLFNGELLVMSRMPYAMARDGLLPRWLSGLHPRHGTPARILIVQAVLYSFLTFFFDFIDLLVVSTWLGLPTYLLTFASPVILRLRRPDLRGPFRIPGGLPVLILTAAVPSLIAVYVLFTIEPRHLLIGCAMASTGPLLYLLTGRWRHREAIDR